MIIIAIIQARMGSSRFPGKMMEELNGYPLIEWVIRRAQQAGMVNNTVLAISNKHEDDVLSEIANKCNCPVFRGSELDVLSRYAATADKYKADIVVRICGDRPLIDPEIIDMAIIDFQSNDDDLTYNHISGDGENWPRGFGVEVISNSLLQWMDNNLDGGVYREHVTPYIWENSEQFKISPVKCPLYMNTGIRDLKLDVDTREDLERLSKICNKLDINTKSKHIIDSFKKTSFYT